MNHLKKLPIELKQKCFDVIGDVPTSIRWTLCELVRDLSTYKYFEIIINWLLKNNFRGDRLFDFYINECQRSSFKMVKEIVYRYNGETKIYVGDKS